MQKLNNLEFAITGKITEFRFNEGRYYTRIMVAAKDPYSSPNVVQVRSGMKLGQKDEIVNCVCALSGWLGSPYVVVDKETGAKESVRSPKYLVEFVDFIHTKPVQAAG